MSEQSKGRSLVGQQSLMHMWREHWPMWSDTVAQNAEKVNTYRNGPKQTEHLKFDQLFTSQSVGQAARLASF